MASNITLSAGVRQNLLSLQNTADLMSTTQNRLATGKKVNSALDNPTNFFTASSLQSRSNDLSSLLDAMSNGVKTLQAADNGLSAITKNLESMQSTLRQARQDKSFQSQSYDVTNATEITVSGGQFGSSTTIALQNSQPGTAASIGSTADYAGPTVAATGSAAAGANARTVITYDANMVGTAGDSVTVDGTEIDLSGVAAGATNVATAIDAALGDDYTVSEGTGADAGKIIVEKTATAAARYTSPEVSFSAGAGEQFSSSTFSYDPARMGASITVDGNAVTVSGTLEDFAGNLQTSLGDDYAVSVDSDASTVTVTSTTAGATPVTVTGLPAATQATTTFDANVANLLAADTIEVNGAAVDLTAAADADDIATAIQGALAGSTVTHDGAGEFTITYAAGAQAAAVVTESADVTNAVATDGLAAAAAPTTTTGQAGATAETVAAAGDEFSVTYNDKTANITVNSGTEEEIATSINNQLQAAGITDVEAKFVDGNLTIEGKNKEAKSLTITGPDAAAIFGTSSVSTGTAPVSDYNATQTVDQFVEEINRTHAGTLRASNDNGKLRIENLSTKELSVSVDKDGAAGPLTASTNTIDGNTARKNLADQFNILRDQLDKLVDDASFNGINLLRGDNLRLTFNETGSSSIDISTAGQKPLDSVFMGLTTLSAEELDSDDNIDAILTDVKSALNTVASQASAFGSNLSIVENRTAFTKSMMNTLQTGADALVLADGNEEAANMLALQTRQQLSSTALSLASQADQAVLRLF